MKKIALFVIATVALLSCKKDYVCTCKMHLEAAGLASIDSTYTIALKSRRKKMPKVSAMRTKHLLQQIGEV